MIQDLGTVYTAELSRRIRSRPFLVGLLIGVVGVLLLTRLPDLMGNAFTGSKSVVLVGNSALTARAKPLLGDDYNVRASLAPQTVNDALLKRERVNAAILLTAGSGGLRVTVYAHDPGSMGKENLRSDLLPLQLSLVMHRTASDIARVSRIPVHVKTVASKFSSASQALATRGIAYMLIFFLYMLILINSQLVMSSVAEEKTSRIAELLVASVDPATLLAGKILSSATLGLLQLVVWIGAALFLGGGPGPSASATQDAYATSITSAAGVFQLITPAVMVAFLVLFVIGFLQLSTLFAGGASLINRTEDLGSITMPLVLPVVAALFIAIGALGSPDSSLSVIASFVPILAPFVMFARIAVSNVPLWQVALCLLVNLLALYGIALLGGKLYRVGMLMYGRAPSLRQMWSVLRN